MVSKRVGRLPDLPSGVYGVDIETTGGTEANPFQHEIVAVGVSDGERTWIIENIGFNDLRSMIPFLQSEDHIKVMHNRIFDMGFLAHKLDTKINKTYCSLIIERMLNNNQHPSYRVDNGLQAVLSRRCGIITDKEVRDQFESWNGEPLTEEQFEYLVRDTKYLPEIMQQQVKEINEKGMSEVARLETELGNTFLKMYLKGVAFDMDLWKEAIEEINAYCNKLYNQIRSTLQGRRQVCALCSKLDVIGLDSCPVCDDKGFHPYHYQDQPNHPEMNNEDFRKEVKEVWEELKTDEASSIHTALRSKKTWDEDKPYSVQAARLLALKAVGIEHPLHEYDIWANFDYYEQALRIVDYLGADMDALISYDKYGEPEVDNDGNVKHTTDKNVLKDYIAIHDDDAADYFETIMDWRKWTKLRGWGYDKYVNPVSELIHPDWNQVLPRSGRLSCGEPNLQNVDSGRDEDKPNMRKLFPAREGYALAVADFGQQEPRILAQYSGDKRLIEAANTSDIYLGMARAIYARDDIVKGDIERHLSKTVTLALSYGAGAPNVAKTAGVPLSDAERAYNKFKETYSTAVRWGDRQIFKAKRLGYVETMMGRKLWFQELDKIHNKNLPFTHYARVARNMPIQGTGADMIKLAMLRIDNELEERGFDAWIRQQVHDELVIEFRLGLGDDVKELVHRHMTEVMNEMCPDVLAIVDISIGKGWTH